MERELAIRVAWEALDAGSPEERACFAAIGIQAKGQWLTEGRDSLANRLREAPLLSAYHLAEWMAWNWWRLRWEPRARSEEWLFAHRMSSIGGGYIWPNITIFSDGERVALIATPTRERPETPFRYISDVGAVVPAGDFELAVDEFIEQVLQRLQEHVRAPTNLDKIWKSVLEERHTPDLARRRKLEALLGQHPDESEADVLERLVQDASELSVAAVEELAADRGHGNNGHVLTASELKTISGQFGHDASVGDVAQVPLPKERHTGNVAAWVLGAQTAQALRSKEGLGAKPITDSKLAEMAGVQKTALAVPVTPVPVGISFALDSRDQKRSKIVLRSKWHTGRRFELARLLADRVIGPAAGQLFLATRAYTYRQKFQRAFAAELLSPFETVDRMLDGDYSSEKQLDIANYFDVSDLTIRTALINHRRLEREDLDPDLFTLAA